MFLQPTRLGGKGGILNMITFDPMREFMEENGITQYQLLKNGILLPAHVTRLSYNHNFTLKFIDKLCRELNCQPGDLIEYVKEPK